VRIPAIDRQTATRLITIEIVRLISIRLLVFLAIRKRYGISTRPMENATSLNESYRYVFQNQFDELVALSQEKPQDWEK